uniref:Nuclear-pore anchor n=1 Tax=Solanum tuberosum TaxID=4113 RepID=M1BCI7_SOLTU
MDCLAVLASFVAIYSTLCHGQGACPSVISLLLPLAKVDAVFYTLLYSANMKQILHL